MRYTEKKYETKNEDFLDLTRNFFVLVFLAPYRLLNEISQKIMYLKREAVEKLVLCSIVLATGFLLFHVAWYIVTKDESLVKGFSPILIQFVTILILGFISLNLLGRFKFVQSLELGEYDAPEEEVENFEDSLEDFDALEDEEFGEESKEEVEEEYLPEEFDDLEVVEDLEEEELVEQVVEEDIQDYKEEREIPQIEEDKLEDIWNELQVTKQEPTLDISSLDDKGFDWEEEEEDSIQTEQAIDRLLGMNSSDLLEELKGDLSLVEPVEVFVKEDPLLVSSDNEIFGEVEMKDLLETLSRNESSYDKVRMSNIGRPSSSKTILAMLNKEEI